MYKFDNIEEDIFVNKLKYICHEEDITYTDRCLKFIYKISEGDLRKGISLLQYCSLLSGKKITKEDLLIVSGELDDTIIHNFLNNQENFNFNTIQLFIKKILHQGHSSDSIIASLLRILKKNNKLNDITKAKIGMCISESNKKMCNGSSEYLNLLNIFCNLI
jgi:DNA polymerase III gamma/tau subunit